MKKIFGLMMALLICLVSVQIANAAPSITAKMSENEIRTFVLENREYEIEVLVISETSDSGRGSVKFRINGEVTDELFTGDAYRIADDSKILVNKIWNAEEKSEVEFIFSAYQQPSSTLGQDQVCCQTSDGKFLSTTEECINKLHGTPRHELGLWECTPGYGNPTMKIDLANYPELFFERDVVNAVLVVGDTAPAEDVIAATDIAVSFKGKQIKPTALASELKPNEERSLYRNIISIGRPCDNAVTAAIMNTDDCHAGLKPGQALIKLYNYNGFAHLVVFGYTNLETRQAARALSTQKMKGMELILDFGEGEMPQPSECKDSDGGVNQFIKGTAYGYGSFVSSPEYKGEDVERTDYCATDRWEEQCKGKDCLVEYYCRSPKEMDYKVMPCPNGCENGACIKGNEEPEDDSNSGQWLPAPPIEETKDKECVGCRKNGACMQFGIRLVENKVPVYCDIDSTLKPQKENGNACQNNYECLSNTCNDGVCQSISEKIESIRQDLQEQKGILEKIFGFFKKIFG